MILLLCSLLIISLLCFVLLKFIQRILAQRKLQFIKKYSNDATLKCAYKIIGFFHPYCNAGGGGERVLWSAIAALQKRYGESIQCIVYTGDTDVKRDVIISKIKERFNIHLKYTDETKLIFIYLSQRKWVEADCYPRFTLLGQSLGSIWLGIEAMWKCIPDVFIDTMGYAFTYPLFKYLCGCKVACYVHYPTVSTDMLQRVSNGQQAYNNQSIISGSKILSRIKIEYYKLFAMLYGTVGRQSKVVNVNSTWTNNHIQQIWKIKPTIIFPPCNVDEFLKINSADKNQIKKKLIVSIGQFRPEKDHPLQIKAFAKFLQLVDECDKQQFMLNIVGSCRNAEDMERVEELRLLAKNLNISEHVDFRLNVPFQELEHIFASSTVALHTMWNEHFGIGIVECMAAGLIMIAHNSGGPCSDIISTDADSMTGFLASTLDEYAETLHHIFYDLDDVAIQAIKNRAWTSVARFTDSQFEIKFLESVNELL